MARSKSTQPTEVELLILRVLWNEGQCGVGTIHEYLQTHKETNYSTTVKMLAVMRSKKLVTRNEKVTPHMYRAAVTEKKTQQGMLNDLIKRAYDGSAGSLVMQALSSKKATNEEIAEIEKLLAKMKRAKENK